MRLTWLNTMLSYLFTFAIMAFISEYGRLILTATFLPSCILLTLLNIYPDMADLEPKQDNVSPVNTCSFFSNLNYVRLYWLSNNHFIAKWKKWNKF